MLRKSLLTTSLELVDGLVDLYLDARIFEPLKLHDAVTTQVDKVLRPVLDRYRHSIPEWFFTGNVLPYFRMSLVIPCLLLITWGKVVLPSLLVLCLELGDVMDEVLSRVWTSIQREREVKAALMEKEASKQETQATTAPAAETHSDDESFEVVTTGSPHSVLSWANLHRNRTFGSFLGSVSDKAFLVPCWIALLHSIATSGHFRIFQYFTLLYLILAETICFCLLIRAFYCSVGVRPKEDIGDSSANKSDEAVGEAKQTLLRAGTCLFILPLLRYVGLVLLLLAMPLAYESIRRQAQKRVIYVSGRVETFNHKTLRFWMQAKAMGSRLIVGVPGERKTTDLILNACACASVDEVIAEAPELADLLFLETRGIDFVVCTVGQAQFVTDEVLNAKRCLVIGEDGVARLQEPKKEGKQD